MRLAVVIVALLTTASAVAAQEAAEPSPAPVNWLCDNAFVQVELELATTAGAAGADPAFLDDAIKACASVADFEAGAAQHPTLLGETPPMAWLEARCTSPELAVYSTCVSLLHALATPSPTATPETPPTAAEPTVTPPPDTAAEPESEPKAKAGSKRKTRLEDQAVDDGKVRVPSVRAKVPGARRVEYFDIKGRNWRQLTRSTARQTRKRCGNHRAQACLETRIANVRPVYKLSGSSCTLTGVKATFTTIAHMPRWVAPARVQPELAWVWRKSIDRTGWHEAQHAKISNRAFGRLPKLVRGKPCSRFAKITQKWWRSLTREQHRFDRRDYPKSARVHARWWLRANERFDRR